LAIGFLYWFIRLPGPNGLGFTTTALEASRAAHKLKGKNIIITGGHSGIGMPTVEALARFPNPNIWLLARPGNNGISRCEKFAAAVRITSNNPNIQCEEMDFASFDSVKSFAMRWKSLNLPLHHLILNAGVGVGYYKETQDGYQYIWQCNHLGQFLLTNLLLDNLKLGKPSRVVVVSSNAHLLSNINWEDISGNGTWFKRDSSIWMIDSLLAYGQSKSANILFANKLNEILEGYGVSNSLHPGFIKTSILNKTEGHFLLTLGDIVDPIMGKTLSQGAATTVYLATAPEWENRGGEYFEDCNISILRTPFVMDKSNAEKLWKMSLESVEKWLT